MEAARERKNQRGIQRRKRKDWTTRRQSPKERKNIPKYANEKNG